MRAVGYYICLGDKTECGGVVQEGDSTILWHGLLHSLEGHAVTCGYDGKTYRILGGVSHFTNEGRRVAGTLDSISGCPCRAKLLPSVFTATYENEGRLAPSSRTVAETTTGQSSGFKEKPQASNPRPASLTGTKPCDHPDRMEELASYIADEMNRNIKHPSVLEMKELNSYDPVAETKEYMALPFYLRLGSQPDFHTLALAKQARAFALWTERVGQNRPWDHKLKIKQKFGGDVYHKQGAYDYFYDIWSNIHYGYVGIAAGFSESVLLDGAGAEQIGSDTVRKFGDWKNKPGPHRSVDIPGLRAWDDIPDRKSIIIGINFFLYYPHNGVTAEAIMNKVLSGDPSEWGEGIRVHKCE